MRNRLVAYGAAALLIAVVLGAFGAHGLRERITADALGQWRTGVEYQFYHGLGLLLLATLAERLRTTPLRWAGRLMVAGMLFFSGSLYLLSTRDLIGAQELVGVLGPLTPIGGLCFVAAWALVFITALRQGDPG